ncbi:flagellar hook-associated protein FlgK [Sphingomonas sp. TREG-RG-20F-R18-01]|uniref:flagellar hook-associated protein FlgK n=1 Tax=Sphingomonas sp. TREG-RG-20F-R18-01 TaxID=2914982 RepID=UPI001F5AF9B3|nr:flagellar hook-associated protein FlgK [Sphingomonas sp. TREG-RG-20F-R18-01]
MSDMLSIGASGVKAYQTALTTVSDNIANASTPGYAKRTTDLSEIAPATGLNSATVNGSGFGVTTSGITRSADALRDADVRTSQSDLARSDTSITWLGQIETALTGNQLGDRLTSFFNASKAVAADPTATTPRAALLEQATAVAGSFSATGKALDQLDSNVDTTAANAVSTINGLGASLAKVNDGLSRVKPGSVGAAQLADQRDSILDQMSAISDVSVSIDSYGRAAVKLGNAGGPSFVSGNQAETLQFARGTDGVIAFSLQRSQASVTPSGGALAGVVEGAQRISDARIKLDAIATSFTDGVNAVQQGGADLDSKAGTALFATGTSPTDITVALTDPRGVAAAAVGAGPRDNSNLGKLDTLRTSGAFESNTTALVSGNAAALAARKQVADAQGAIRTNALSARDAVSGVNLDTEAVDLLRFQQAYQASSRVIQVAKDTLQSILDLH